MNLIGAITQSDLVWVLIVLGIVALLLFILRRR
jgi:hypothetical protein